MKREAGGGREQETWAFVNIGHPFPENPVRVRGEINQYIALAYIHGTPVCGRAWSNGGKVDASIPFAGKEYKGDMLKGRIQILTNSLDSFGNDGFWYDWVPYKSRFGERLTPVQCGKSTPILMEHPRTKEYIVGNVDTSTDHASCSFDGQVVSRHGGLGNYLVLVRNTNPPPSMCSVRSVRLSAQSKSVKSSSESSSSKAAPCVNGMSLSQLIAGTEDHWTDKRVGDQFPGDTVLGMNRPLKSDPGVPPEQHVALWFRNGIPVLGRCWSGEKARIQASFGVEGKEFTGNVGSIQVLTFTTAFTYGYEYSWRPYKEMKGKKSEKGPDGMEAWTIVRVHDSAPCVMKSSNQGYERLGQLRLGSQKASAGLNGKEKSYTGKQVLEFYVLCRRPSLGDF